MTTTAFVLTGGGSLGAGQVGMLQALSAHGIRPDLLVGTSSGAMNAAWVAGHGMSTDSLAELASIWTRLRRTDVFPVGPRQVLRGLLGLSTAVSTNTRLSRLVAARTGIHELTEAQMPVHLVAADLLSGRDVLISAGPVVTAVLASAAVPGVLPPVEHAGLHLVDGAVAHHTGVSQAIDLGATHVYVLPTGSPCALPRPPGSAIGVALQALNLLLQQRLAHEVAALHGAATIKVLPPLCPLAVSAADFGHAADLVDRGRRASQDWITTGAIDLPSPERFLSLHHHDSRATDDQCAVERRG